MALRIILAIGAFILAIPSFAQETVADRMNSFLVEGKIDKGIEVFSGELDENPTADERRYALGILQFIDSVENLAQSMYEFGLKSSGGIMNSVPFLRVPVPQNPDPKTIRYKDLRAIFGQMRDDLLEAEITLAGIERADIDMPLYIGLASLDIDKNGTIAEGETLWRIYAGINPRVSITQEQAEEYLIMLDGGDVQWLRGYCHMLAALIEIILAYDQSEQFNQTAHIFFENPETRFHPQPLAQQSRRFNFENIADAIAFIHLFNYPVKEADRLKKARVHLLKVIELSRDSWKFYLGETDDNHEWIPNPNQTGVIPGVKITQQMVDRWMAFLDETEKILNGELLVPYSRRMPTDGVNMRKVFDQPTDFDLILWIQGSAAVPYLEDGETTSPDFWRELNRNFNGNFVGFALWFN